MPQTTSSAVYIVESVLISASINTNSSNTVDIDGKNSSANSTGGGEIDGDTSGAPNKGITTNMMIVIIVVSGMAACLCSVMATYCIIRKRRIESAKVYDEKKLPPGLTKIKKTHAITS